MLHPHPPCLLDPSLALHWPNLRAINIYTEEAFAMCQALFYYTLHSTRVITSISAHCNCRTAPRQQKYFWPSPRKVSRVLEYKVQVQSATHGPLPSTTPSARWRQPFSWIPPHWPALGSALVPSTHSRLSSLEVPHLHAVGQQGEKISVFVRLTLAAIRINN